MAQINFPNGVWPAMITPLKPDMTIDWSGIDILTDWYIDAGVAGLFAVGQSSEMFYLTDDERLSLAKRVVEHTNGRVPVIASGTFGGSVAKQANFIKKMMDVGVTGVTVLASEMVAQSESDDILWERLQQLIKLTDSAPLALYECPQPYHRLISPALVERAAATGRFHLLKETSRSIEQVIAKINAAQGTPLKIFNADATTLLESLQAGAKGYCGIAANFYPELVVWLCEIYASNPEKAIDIQAVIGSSDAHIHLKYPVNAKFYRDYCGHNMLTVSKSTDAVLDTYDKRVLSYLARHMQGLTESLRTSLS